MPVRTIEELVYDVLDTMINARPEVGGAEYYSDNLEWVTRQLVGIIFDHPDESIIERYTQEVLGNTGFSRGIPSGRTLRLSNPGMVASTLGSPRSQSPVTTEESRCHACGSVSQLIRSPCLDDECSCFGQHLEDVCHTCGQVFNATPHVYNAPEDIRIHRWIIVPLEDRPSNNRHSRSSQYLLECDNCHMHVNSWVYYSDNESPSLNYSTGFNSPCGANLDHDWMKTSYGDDNSEDRYVCDSCGEVVVVPYGSNWFSNTACPGFPKDNPGLTLRFNVKKNLPEPEVIRPTRFERDPVI
jgi:hypothetical protein